MHKLTYSLLVVVLLAIIGIGWGLDKLSDQMQYQAPDNQALIRDMAGISAVVLNASDSPTEHLAQDFSPQNFDFALVNAQDFPLPESLNQTFDMATPLLLESLSPCYCLMRV